MTKISNNRGQLRKSVLTSVLTVLGMVSTVISTPASAAKFGLKIVNESGQAMEGVAVCIGLPGNYTQFGSLLTDDSGLAMVDVPAVPLLLTISKSRVGGIELHEPARGFNLIKQVTLKQGVPGPTCNVVGLDKTVSTISILDVQVTDSTFSTTLKPTVVGGPTEYRVSSTSSFKGVKWKRYETSIPLSATLSDEDEVYLQMRRYQGTAKSWIEAESDVISVKLPTFE